MTKVAIVACSNGLQPEFDLQNRELIDLLSSTGAEVVQSNYIYAKSGPFQGTPKERAGELMRMFRDPQISEIYDISGGDIANQVLPFLDFEDIAKSNATFWGYSDLTTIINAIYTMTGRESILYQIKNMVWGNCREIQRERFFHRDDLFTPEFHYSQGNATGGIAHSADLFTPEFHFCQGHTMQGIVVGGNVRCFLKLSGTRFFPDLQGKILLLESMGGMHAQMATYFAQLQQLGAFEKVNGILLGNFREMERNGCESDIIELIREYAEENLPIAKTSDIGHRNDSKAIVIGKYLRL